MKQFTVAHKKISVGGLLLLLVLGYFTYGAITSTAGETRYVTAKAATGTVIVAISGSGQVTTLDQIDVTAKVAGDITQVLALQGETVKAGQIIARIDATDAYKTLRNAETSLESARITREDVLEPADALTLMQSENSLARMVTTKQNAEDTLNKTYDDAFNSVSNAFLDIPSLVSGLYDILFTTSGQLGGTNVNNIDYYANTAALFDARGTSYGKDADAKYQIALAKYNKNFADYKALDRNANADTIIASVEETYDTALAISDAIKSTNNLIQFFQDQMTQHNQRIPTLSNTQLNTLNGYTGTANSHLTSLLSIQNTIKTNKNTIIDATRSIEESTLSLAKLKAGATALEIRAQDLIVQQRSDAVRDAQEALADYTVRAPLGGVLAKVSVSKGQTVGGGANIATVVATHMIARLSLNEVDAAKIVIGQKTMLTFDAIEDLSISGTVAQIDTIGTVSQGVVTYAVDISFDTQDTRVKSGMSVNASIQTEVKAGVLTVPVSAVKTEGNTSYVEVFDSPIAPSMGNQGTASALAPRRQEVVIGLSDDTMTEIVSGITTDTQVVTRTIAPTGGTTTSAPSLFQSTGSRTGSGSGSGLRIPGS